MALFLIVMVGCFPDFTPSNADTPKLYERFHGKYNVISSVSSEAVDVNLDGKASIDMTKEIVQLAPEYGQQLELRIYSPSKNSNGNSFLFYQFWPEQAIYISNKEWNGEDIAYQPGLIVNFLQQGVVRYFTFSPDLSKLLVKQTNYESPFRWVFPESVMVDNSTDVIQIVNKRRLYTSAAVKDVVITTRYKRYTMIT